MSAALLPNVRSHVPDTSAVLTGAGGCDAGRSSGPARDKEVGVDCLRPAEKDQQAGVSILIV